MNDTSLIFDDYALPGLPAGDYTVSVGHELLLEGEQLISKKHQFTVTGARYCLPPGTVHACFPQEGAKGNLAQSLPHIILCDPHMAWLHSSPASNTAPKPDMVLLVFEESELRFPNTELAPIQDERNRCYVGSQQSFIAQFDKNDTLIGPDFLASIPANERSGEQTCRYIKLHAKTFSSLMPDTDDLIWTTHTRKEEVQDSAYAVIHATRFPAAAQMNEEKRYVAHLVSIDGWLKLMRTNGENKELDAHIEKNHEFCMISFANWTFTSTSQNREHTPFSRLAHDLAYREGKAVDLRLLVPQATASDLPVEVATRLQDGFVPLPQVTWTGENLFCWYRGPLIAVDVAQPVEKHALREQFSETLAVDAEDKVFDVSYTCAWYLGRNLTLANRPLMQAWFHILKHFRRSAMRLALQPHLAREGLLTKHIFPTSSQLYSSVLTSDFLGSIPQKLQTPAQVRATPIKATAPLTIHQTKSAVQNLLDDDGAVSELPQDDVNTLVKNIASMLRLEQVPFAALVPQADMLPPESLRLFTIDTQWLQALMDGAMSTVLRRSTDHAIYAGLRERIWNAALNHTPGEPSTLGTENLGGDAQPNITGLLLRSEMVAVWPNLIIEAKDIHGKPLPLLRRQNLGLNVCIVLFEGIIHQLRIAPPLTLLPPGIDEDESIHCRSLGKKMEVGEVLPLDIAPSIIMAAYWRDTNLRIVKLGGDKGLVSAVQNRLREAGELDSNQAITPGAMALQWITSPQQLVL